MPGCGCQHTLTKSLTAASSSSRGRRWLATAATAAVLLPLLLLWAHHIIYDRVSYHPVIIENHKRRNHYYCTPSQIELIAAQDPVHHSACPLQIGWMQALLEDSTHHKEAVLISVGCNRGDDLLAAAREWSRNDSFAFRKIAHLHAQYFTGGRACPYPPNIDYPPVFFDDPRPVRAFCIEPMSSTFDAVSTIFREQGWDQQIHTIKAAVSSTAGETRFPVSGAAGVESLGLGMETGAGGGTETVQVITIDDLVSEQGLKCIDVLSIDTEGNDANVIIGAINSLPIVRFLEFEYHSVGYWGQTDLQLLISMLDQHGFDCYWQGNEGQLWRLTGCWHDSYYTKRTWSNIACPKRSEFHLHSTMERIATQQMKR